MFNWLLINSLTQLKKLNQYMPVFFVKNVLEALLLLGGSYRERVALDAYD